MTRLVPEAEIEREGGEDAVVVRDVAAKDRLAEIPRRGALGERAVEAGGSGIEEAGEVREDELPVRIGGAELVVLQPLECEAVLDGVLAASQVDVVVDLVGVEVEVELAGGFESALEVADAADVDEANRQIGREAKARVTRRRVDPGKGRRRNRNDVAVADLQRVEAGCW